MRTTKKQKIRKIMNIILRPEKRKPKIWRLINGIPQDHNYKKEVKPYDITINRIICDCLPKKTKNE